jgi:hypothetical protein
MGKAHKATSRKHEKGETRKRNHPSVKGQMTKMGIVEVVKVVEIEKDYLSPVHPASWAH